MRLLELFSGTHSVGKVAVTMGYEVTSLDLSDADINIDIMNWDYKSYPVGYFECIWASPPCQYFSHIRASNIGRHGITRESIENDIIEKGLPILRKTEEIIEYFQPKTYYIENPHTGRMKEYIDRPYYVVDYCRYGFQCRKRTAIWTNIKGFKPKLCNKECGSFFNNRHLRAATGGTTKQKGQGSGSDKHLRYMIPSLLVQELLNSYSN